MIQFFLNSKISFLSFRWSFDKILSFSDLSSLCTRSHYVRINKVFHESIWKENKKDDKTVEQFQFDTTILIAMSIIKSYHKRNVWTEQ
jgi:hypothetical protein